MNSASQLAPVRAEDVERYLSYAMELTTHRKLGNPVQLSRQQKVIVTKIHKNLAYLCKLTIKELKEVIKAEPAYQSALADLYFDKKLNNYLLISQEGKQQHTKNEQLLHEAQSMIKSNMVTFVDYRIQFTLSNIAKKTIMKPAVLLLFRLKNGGSLHIYFNVEQFSALRNNIAKCMKDVYGIQLRAL